eukprot:1149290_1
MAATNESNEPSNKAIKYLKKAVSKLKALKLPSTAAQPQSKPQCFAICIDHLGPIQIPAFYIPPKGSNGKIEIVLHASIFDSNQLCFVGRTWKSKPFVTNNMNQALPIDKFWIYLKSAPYESKWIVLELAAQIRSEGVIVSQISLGWSVIHLFTNTRALVDVHPDQNHNDPLQRESKVKSCFLFHGSPSYLLINKDIDSIPESAIKISFRLFTFKKLINISHLLCSETIIGPHDIIPGLGHTAHIPNNPYQNTWNMVLHMKPIDFIVSSPVLALPEGFEVQILEELSKIRKNNFCAHNRDQTSARIIARQLNISFYNGSNIITTPTVIQLQTHAMNPSTLSWDGDIKIRVHANLEHSCWLLISLNYHIEWKDDPLSAHSPSHHHSVCLGRDLVNITSNELILNGQKPTQLTLSSSFAWIDDCPIFNHKMKQDIAASFIIRFASAKDSVSHARQISTKSSKPPTLSTMHHVSSFDTHDNTSASQRNTMNPLSIPSTTHTLQSPQGYVAMNWDEIKKQSLMMIPSNVLQKKMDSTSRLALLQESFAVNTWQKIQKHSTSHGATTKTLKHSQSIRSLRGGYVTFDFAPFDTMPSRKIVDIDTELRLSHKRRFVICCNALSIQCKQLLLNHPMEAIMIQLDFMGQKQMSPVIQLSSNSTINHLRESLMDEDKYESLPFHDAYAFEFTINPKQIRPFIHFLNEKYAIFTVFNANTMFQIGSCRICLRDLLLQNTNDDDDKENAPMVQQNFELPISLTKITDNPSCIIETQPNISLNHCNSTMNGKLCVQIVHEAIDLSDTAKLQYAHWSENLITNTCDEDGALCVRNLRLMHSTNKRVRAEALYENVECTQKLETVPCLAHQSGSYPTQHHITTKWNIPIEAIHEISNKSSPYIHDEQWKLRRSNIDTMNDFRDRKKHQILHQLSAADQFVIQPSMGQIVFFEIEFVNPWNERKAFGIKIDDEELKLVTNIKQSSYLKSKYNASTTMKRHLFEKMNQIILNAQEKVFIPFKFQSFATSSIQKRMINICVEDEDASSVIEFNLNVEPIPFVVDRIFDVFSFVENRKFVCHLPLPSIQNIDTTNDECVLSVQCSDDATAFELDSDHQSITFRVDIAGDKETFYFVVYNDKYFVDINEIWECNIHSYLNQNGHGMLGGIMKNTIHLPSSKDEMEFHCDCAHGMQLELMDDELNIEYAPTQCGKHLIRIHGVVPDASRVVYSCLLIMHVEMPRIHNSFLIHIEGNKEDHQVTRKLPYHNGYNQERTFELVSNDPSVIRITNPVMLIPPQSEMDFVLEVMPNNMSSKEVLLFVTECGNLEQCLRIEVKKGKLTNL